MKRVLLLGAGLLVVAGGGVALAQMPPPPPGGEHGWEGHEGPWMHHHPHGAGFFFRRGDMEIGIRCSPRETMQACVAAAGTLIDKVATPQPNRPAGTPAQ